MIKYDFTCVFCWYFIGSPIIKYMAKVKGLSKRVAKEKLKKEYKAMLNKTEDIKDSHLRFNLIWGCLLLSAVKAFDNVSYEEFDKCLRFQFQNKILLKNMRKNFNVFKSKIKFDKPYESNLKNDWEYSIDISKFPYEQTTSFKRCGLHSLCKQEDMLEYLPYMCKLDYLMYTKQGCELIRTKALSNGYNSCIFRFINSEFSDVRVIMDEEGIKGEDLI